MELVERQVGQEIVPDVESSEIGAVAATAIVPLVSGTVRVRVVFAEIPDKSKLNFLVLSELFWKVVELSTRVLLVKVCV